MKKVIIAGVMTALLSGSALAADGWDSSTPDWKVATGSTDNIVKSGFLDTASAQLTFKGALPLVMPGEYVTITGLNGSTLVNGELEILGDGSFGTLVPVTTEIHKYNADAKEVGPLLTGTDATNITWTQATKPTVSAISSDTTGATAILTFNGAEVLPNDGEVADTGAVDALNKVVWGVKNAKHGEIVKLVSGDEITVTSNIDATVEF
ncbi:hypothetical protein [Photobacterium damselae]|uniref:hypothetical protein n=1 Tax=Photobacterium damselae TaxID=38293 RepID=UPI0040694A1E